jgi:hypothetical protein
MICAPSPRYIPRLRYNRVGYQAVVNLHNLLMVRHYGFARFPRYVSMFNQRAERLDVFSLFLP